MNTSNLTKNEQSNNEKTDREQVSREFRSLERDRRGNVLATKEELADCHEATRLAVFLGAIAHDKFVQDRNAYKTLHQENAKYIPHLDDISRPEGITLEAEDKFAWCPEVMTAAAIWAKYRKSIQKK
jgi:hypothetical protein